MYSDLIDRARKPDSATDKRVTAESYLFQSILNGNHPTLVLPQTFDSELVLSLLKSNQSKDFLSAFEKKRSVPGRKVFVSIAIASNDCLLSSVQNTPRLALLLMHLVSV